MKIAELICLQENYAPVDSRDRGESVHRFDDCRFAIEITAAEPQMLGRQSKSQICHLASLPIISSQPLASSACGRRVARMADMTIAILLSSNMGCFHSTSGHRLSSSAMFIRLLNACTYVCVMQYPPGNIIKAIL